jgi:hypothetical protein
MLGFSRLWVEGLGLNDQLRGIIIPGDLVNKWKFWIEVELRERLI